MFVCDNSLPIWLVLFLFVSAVGMYWNLFLKETSRSYGLFVFFCGDLQVLRGVVLDGGPSRDCYIKAYQGRLLVFWPSNFTQINMFLFHTVWHLQ